MHIFFLIHSACQPYCDIKSGSSVECLAPDLGLGEEAIQWLNQSEQQRGDSGSRFKRNVLHDIDTSAAHRFKRQASSNGRVEEGRVLDQEAGVKVYVQVFLDHGEESRNETMGVVVIVPTFQPADIDDPPVDYRQNMAVKILVCLHLRF